MKLYTENDLIIAIGLTRHGNPEWSTAEIINDLTPIEIPSDEEVWRWWQTQKFQKEQGEQEYTMLYEIDLPKILKSFTEHLIQGGNNEQQ